MRSFLIFSQLMEVSKIDCVRGKNRYNQPKKGSMMVATETICTQHFKGPFSLSRRLHLLCERLLSCIAFVHGIDRTRHAGTNKTSIEYLRILAPAANN